MRTTLLFFVLSSFFLVGCMCTGSSSSSALTNCAQYDVPQDIKCKGSDCTWRGTKCEVDECGIPPIYPGYAASPQPNGTVVVLEPQWTKLSTWIDEERAYRICEITRSH